MLPIPTAWRAYWPRILTTAMPRGRPSQTAPANPAIVPMNIRRSIRRGLRLTFEDRGPGIRDVDLAMKDGYSTGNGLGLGLSGARRLSNEFSIQSTVGEGTRVTIVRWR